jgi:uncharacterized protein YegL
MKHNPSAPALREPHMPRRPPPLDPDHNPVHRFAQALREVHRHAGKPSRDWLGRQINVSHATVSHILNGDRFPSWQHTEALIKACGGDPESFRDLWLQIDTMLDQAHHVPKSYRPVGHGETVMPLYLVCDVSASLHGYQIDSLNHACEQLVELARREPLIAHQVRLCLISFSSDAKVLMPLTHLWGVNNIPQLVAEGGTDYYRVFELLRHVIEEDVSQLKRDRFNVYRPIVFFITYEEPSGGLIWEEAHQRLTDSSWPVHPHILAFGVGDVSEDTIRRIATFKGFLAREAASPIEAVHEFMSALTRSIIVAAPHPALDPSVRQVFFENVDGVTELP